MELINWNREGCGIKFIEQQKKAHVLSPVSSLDFTEFLLIDFHDLSDVTKTCHFHTDLSAYYGVCNKTEMLLSLIFFLAIRRKTPLQMQAGFLWCSFCRNLSFALFCVVVFQQPALLLPSRPFLCQLNSTPRCLPILNMFDSHTSGCSQIFRKCAHGFTMRVH